MAHVSLLRRLTDPSRGEKLNSWAGQPDGTAWEICYTSFTMGSTSPEVFHQNCDQYSQTLIAVQNAGGYTFGGFVRSCSSFSPPLLSLGCVPLKVRAVSAVCLWQASGSWDLATCCAGSGNDCGGTFCYDRTSASESFLFGLGPEAPARFGPTELNTFYQFVHPLGWPVWGAGVLSSTDLFIGEYNGTLGAIGDCYQGVTYTGSAGQICGGRDNWGETNMEVWRLADNAHEGDSALLASDIAHEGDSATNPIELEPPPQPSAFVPLFAVSGHDDRGTKQLFVRPGASSSQNVLNADWVITACASWPGGPEGNSSVLRYAGSSWGVQLWGPLDLSAVRIPGGGVIRVNITAYHIGNLTSTPSSSATALIPIAEGRAAFRPLIRGLSLNNADERAFSRYDTQTPKLGGGGFVDCNSCMGEAGSHGAFLAGLAAVYQADRNISSLSQRYLTKVGDLPAMAGHIGTAVQYLLELQSSQTGEIRHQFCQDFSKNAGALQNQTSCCSSASTPCTCRCDGCKGHCDGPHHTAIALMGLIRFLRSQDDQLFEQLPVALQALVPRVITSLNLTLQFLADGAPLSSQTNGSPSHTPSCIGGSCLARPYHLRDIIIAIVSQLPRSQLWSIPTGE